MKKIIVLATITAAVAAATLTGMHAEARKASKPSNLYPATMKVIDIDESDDLVTVETATGFTYGFYGAQDLYNNDLVSLIMDDNGTEVITDDKIVDVQYSGYWIDGGEIQQ